MCERGRRDTVASRTAIGLDIGTSGVRAAELSFGKGGATLRRFGQVALPPGAVRDGEVADPETVAGAIRQLWASGKFNSKKVVMGVANQRVIVRQVDLPWLPADELRKSLAFQVQEFIPLPVEQAILDFHPVEEFTNESGGRMLRVLLVAASRDMVMGLLDSARQAGLNVCQIDLTPFAVLRAAAALDAVGPHENDAEAIVDIGARVTNILVHQGGVPRFVRILLMGGEDLTEAVAERMGVPIEEAERIKRDLGVQAVPAQLAEPHPAARSLDAATSALVDEIRGSLDYYRAQPSAVSVHRLVLSGGGSQLSGLEQRLASAIRMPVSVASPSTRVKATGAASDFADIDAFMTVPVGLAMSEVA